MKLTTQKQPFFGDFYIIKRIRLASISSLSRYVIVFLLAFFLNFNIFAVEKNDKQTPVKKTIVAPLKSPVPSKTAKAKKGKNGKKSIVSKKDTLNNADPASANSPLYNN